MAGVLTFFLEAGACMMSSLEEALLTPEIGLDFLPPEAFTSGPPTERLVEIKK